MTVRTRCARAIEKGRADTLSFPRACASTLLAFSLPRSLGLALLACVAVAWQGLAQTPPAPEKLSFEVASVKANTKGDNRVSIGNQSGQFTAINVPLRLLVTFAYEVQDFQLIGMPDWAETERFDIVAKSSVERPADPAPGPSGPDVRRRVQSLLEERFKLTLRHDTRPLPIYALVRARPDGKTGPGLRPATVDCDAMRGRAGSGPVRGIGPGAGSGPAPTDSKRLDPPGGLGERPQCGMMMAPGKVLGGGQPIARLVSVLSQSVRRVVVDRTELTGAFDIDLTWTPDRMSADAPPGVSLPAIDPNGPSIFTALQEQLGLKLEPQTGPVDVLVIDHIERPTEN